MLLSWKLLENPAPEKKTRLQGFGFEALASALVLASPLTKWGLFAPVAGVALSPVISMPIGAVRQSRHKMGSSAIPIEECKNEGLTQNSWVSFTSEFRPRNAVLYRLTSPPHTLSTLPADAAQVLFDNASLFYYGLAAPGHNGLCSFFHQLPLLEGRQYDECHHGVDGSV